MSENEIRQMITETVQWLNEHTRFAENRSYMQHGTKSVYEHCIQVAEKSCKLAWKHNMKVSYPELIRGALLHDYFLYDWHAKDNNTHRLHGFFHAKKALANAQRDVELTAVEADIIRHHMFPLNLFHPPRCKEAWVVCIADKICAFQETIHRKTIK